ncbi:hypothetical protein HU200_012772 [Digitaria exilis]|uniref:Uncharacterized protein n=1 Tax=Digitaria exilis TaxID=1010633 RepID=A0A835FE60_9POAL|nr:hypothetical protein HU200_012772 [Digitaria exilis]
MYLESESDQPSNFRWAQPAPASLQINHLPARSSSLPPIQSTISPRRNPKHTRYTAPSHATMALRVRSAVALCLLFSLIAVAHCVPPEEAAGDLATDASAAAVTLAPDEEEDILRFGLALEGEAPMEEKKEEEEMVVNPVAEPDPDRSHPDSEQADEKKEQIDADEDEDEAEEEEEEEEKKTKKKNLDKDEKKEKAKNKRKKHGCKEKKEKKIKKHDEQSNDGEGEEEEKAKKQIHRHHRVEKEKTKKWAHHNSGDDDSDDEDEQEKKARRWRKAISRRSRFGHGRRSQREESQTEEVKNYSGGQLALRQEERICLL